MFFFQVRRAYRKNAIEPKAKSKYEKKLSMNCRKVFRSVRQLTT